MVAWADADYCMTSNHSLIFHSPDPLLLSVPSDGHYQRLHICSSMRNERLVSPRRSLVDVQLALGRSPSRVVIRRGPDGLASH